MEKIFICCLSICVILNINFLFVEFSTPIFNLLLAQILLIGYIIKNQRLKKKIEDYEKNQKKIW